MITANNGIFIVAMLFAWALKVGEHPALTASILSAMASWVVNSADEHDGPPSVRFVMAIAAIVFALIAFYRLAIGG